MVEPPGSCKPVNMHIFQCKVSKHVTMKKGRQQTARLVGYTCCLFAARSGELEALGLAAA